MKAPEPTEIERWLLEHAAPRPLDSARATYELMPRQRDRQLAFVDVPYDARREAHWADAARVADYAAHLPDGASRVLDVGPGDGWPSLPIAATLPDVQVVGIDPSPLRVAVCTANAARLELANARFVAADAARLPFADSSFDAVCAASSLEEAAQPEAVFAELARVLRHGGTLRASYQDWRLPAPQVETVLLWGGRVGDERLLLYTYTRRLQQPPMERRYTLLLPNDGDAAALHADALLTAAQAPRAYGETLIEGAWSALGVPLLRHLAPHARRCTVVELRRWTTPWLVGALLDAGFSQAGGTVHPGEVARHVGRDLIARGVTDTIGPAFEPLAAAIGRAAGSRPGDEMVEAVR